METYVLLFIVFVFVRSMVLRVFCNREFRVQTVALFSSFGASPSQIVIVKS
jgi:hypothetical protein